MAEPTTHPDFLSCRLKDYPFILLFARPDRHVAFCHVIHPLCRRCGLGCSSAQSLLLPPVHLLGIRHDLEVAVISILVFRGCSLFQIFVLFLALCRAATSIDL